MSKIRLQATITAVYEVDTDDYDNDDIGSIIEQENAFAKDEDFHGWILTAIQNITSLKITRMPDNPKNPDELRSILRSIQKKCDFKKYEVEKKFADGNNPVKVGDVLVDQCRSIKVEQIGYFYPGLGWSQSILACEYSGPGFIYR